VVVCDRLHAAILSYLSGIPFVYIDQVSGKITKTLNTAFDTLDGCMDGNRSKWGKANSLEEALSLASNFIDYI
jgi:exopolysaccharide biosynthesis predicted pyruvyltransferase EpsI